MRKKLYHVSAIPNINVLQPRVSTHKKPYVYATAYPNFALFFGGKESFGDFDGMYGIKRKKPYFYECYEGALKRRFFGEVCYIYEVDPSNFKKGKTSFFGEEVCEEPVNVLNCEKIENVYEYLLKLNEKKKIRLHFFKDTKRYKETIEKHVFDRLVRFGVSEKKDGETYAFCKERFPSVVARLSSETVTK